MSSSSEQGESATQRIALVGDARAGKSNISQVLRGRPFTSSYNQTTVFNINPTDCLQVYEYNLGVMTRNYLLSARHDCLGAKSIQAVGGPMLVESTLMSYKGNEYILQVTSLMTTVGYVKEILQSMDKETETKAGLVLVGNTIDQENSRQVSKEKGQEMADELGASFVECSARDNVNIVDVFQAFLRERLRKLKVKQQW